jgi:hypothetical protein
MEGSRQKARELPLSGPGIVVQEERQGRKGEYAPAGQDKIGKMPGPHDLVRSEPAFVFIAMTAGNR